MSHIIIIIISENILKIKINDKINEINNEELIEIFCLINAFQILEIKKGNEYDKAWIKIKYKKDMLITEYINIFKIIRIPNLYDYITYFKTINKKFNEQNIDTRIDINDYLEQTENISQELLITMVFKIETNIKELENTKEVLLKMLKINNIDKEVFNIIKQY